MWAQIGQFGKSELHVRPYKFQFGSLELKFGPVELNDGPFELEVGPEETQGS